MAFPVLLAIGGVIAGVSTLYIANERAKETVDTFNDSLHKVMNVSQIIAAMAFLYGMYTKADDFDNFIEITSQISSILLLTTSFFSFYRGVHSVFLLHLFFLTVSLVRVIWVTKSLMDNSFYSFDVKKNVFFLIIYKNEFFKIKSVKIYNIPSVIKLIASVKSYIVYSPIIAYFIIRRGKEYYISIRTLIEDETEKWSYDYTLLFYLTFYPGLKLALGLSYFDNTVQFINLLVVLFVFLCGKHLDSWDLLKFVRSWKLVNLFFNYLVSVGFSFVIQAIDLTLMYFSYDASVSWIPLAEIFCFLFYLLSLNVNDTLKCVMHNTTCSLLLLGILVSLLSAVIFVLRNLVLFLFYLKPSITIHYD